MLAKKIYDPNEKLKCSKCGMIEYARELDIQYFSVQFPEEMIPITGPHIRIYCLRCGYIFYRAAIDNNK